MGCHFYDYITNGYFHRTFKLAKLFSLLSCFNKATCNVGKAQITRNIELSMAIILQESKEYKQQEQLVGSIALVEPRNGYNSYR